MKTLCAIFLMIVLSGCATTSSVHTQSPLVSVQDKKPKLEAIPSLQLPMIYQYILSENGELTEVYRDGRDTVYGPPLADINGFAQPPVITSARLNPRYRTD